MLFDPLIKPKKEDNSEHAGILLDYSRTAALQLTYETKQKSTLDDCFMNFESGQVIKYFTDGAWSMHHLVQYFLEKAGPSIVHVSTWTLTENPARVLLNLKEAGLIQKLNCLFDYRIQDRSPKSFQLIESICDRIKLTKCHAKVATIINDEYGISIVGSANFSKNKRLEAGTIFTDRASALFDESWIKRKINESE